MQVTTTNRDSRDRYIVVVTTELVGPFDMGTDKLTFTSVVW